MADPKSPPLPPAHYINLMQVSHTAREFFLAFGQIAPGQQSGVAHLVTQLVTSPQHAKAMLRALEDNIRRYEERFGAISETGGETPQTVQ